MASWILGVFLETPKVIKDLANEINDAIATYSKYTNDLKFASRPLVVCDGCLVTVGNRLI